MKLNPALNPAIFREYDVRGIAGRDISAPFARLLGRAYATLARKRRGDRRLKVAVGQDCRLSSPEYADALAEGLIEAGVDVLRLGVCPSPLTYFGVFQLELDGGIMVTGSHNPADYNGFKVLIGKDTLHGAGIQELYQEMRRLTDLDDITASQGRGRSEQQPVIPDYIQMLATQFRTRLAGTRKLKVVLDAGNGTAGAVAPELFRAIGAEVIPLFCELDGRFPNHHPDPTEPKNLSTLVEAVLRERADLGLAFDGDADRIGLVDEKGKILFGDEMMVLFSRDLLKERPGATILSEVKSSNRLYEDIKKHGGNAIMWKTGHSLIKSKMKETGALLAGEMSGHMFFADRYFGYDDAIYAACRVYEIVARGREPLSALLADLPAVVNTPEIRVDCEESLKFRLVDGVRATLEKSMGARGAEINSIDGVRVALNGSAWGLIRASNTQPVLVLRFEAPTQGELAEVRTIMVTALESEARRLGHPPIHVPPYPSP